MQQIALFFRENLHSCHKFYTTAGRDGRDKSQLCPSKISTFQVVLQFNRGTSDPDGDGNFDCIPAVDNFQVSLKKAKKTRMKITFYIAL